MCIYRIYARIIQDMPSTTDWPGVDIAIYLDSQFQCSVYLIYVSFLSWENIVKIVYLRNKKWFIVVSVHQQRFGVMMQMY